MFSEIVQGDFTIEFTGSSDDFVGYIIALLFCLHANETFFETFTVFNFTDGSDLT